MRKYLICLLLPISLLSLNSCVYLRLLDVRSRLADFDNHFTAQDDQGDLLLVFNKPVLYAEDLRFLFKSKPSKIDQRDAIETWYWIFVKTYAEGQKETKNFDIAFATEIKDQRFYAFRIAAPFVSTLTKEFILQTCRALGHSKINQRQRKASFSFADKTLVQYPKQEDIIAILGMPYDTQTATGITTLTFQYSLLHEDAEQKTKPLPAHISLSFVSDTGEMAAADIRFANFWIYLRTDKAKTETIKEKQRR